MDIDLVCCFVDGDDPTHLAARSEAWQRARQSGASKLVNATRQFQQVGELTYSIRSALRYMPWLRRVIVVTDGQAAPVDSHLLASDRVRIVAHRDFIPASYLPLFSPPIIESFLHRIDGLSDVWVYHNDDFLLGGEVAADEFVSPDGRLAVHAYPSLIRHLLRSACALGLAPRGYCNPYTFGVSNSTLLLRRVKGIRMHQARTPRHFTQIYRRSTAYLAERVFADDLERFRRLRFRSFEQLSFSTLVTTMESVTHGLARPAPLPAPDLAFHDFLDCSGERDLAGMWQKVRQSRARFLCLNNIPVAERQRFEAVMTERGLGEPVS